MVAPQPRYLPVPLNHLPAPTACSGRGLCVWVDILPDICQRGHPGEGGGQDPPRYLRPSCPGLPVQSVPLPQRGRPAGARHQEHGEGEGRGAGAPQQRIL